MFYVFNKSKIYSYMIALSTVVILFMVAGAINDMVTPSQNTIPTGTNIVGVNHIQENEIKTNILNGNQIVINHIRTNTLSID